MDKIEIRLTPTDGPQQPPEACAQGYSRTGIGCGTKETFLNKVSEREPTVFEHLTRLAEQKTKEAGAALAQRERLSARFGRSALDVSVSRWKTDHAVQEWDVPGMNGVPF